MRLIRTHASAAVRRQRPRVILPSPCLRSVRVRGGVYVPSDSFGGQSPEKKAAGILRTFFTFVAARVVLAQLEGSGRGTLGAYDAQGASDLHHFLQNVPMRDGDEWLAQLMRQNTSLGLRLMEVRDSYCGEAFEWDQLQRLAREDMKGANTKLMRQFAAASLAVSLGQDEAAAASAAATSRASWRSEGNAATTIGREDGATAATCSSGGVSGDATSAQVSGQDPEQDAGGDSASVRADDAAAARTGEPPAAPKRATAAEDSSEGSEDSKPVG